MAQPFFPPRARIGARALIVSTVSMAIASSPLDPMPMEYA